MQSIKTTIYTVLILIFSFPAICLAENENHANVPSKDNNANDKFIVCLDAGHGGKDPGTVGSKPTNREKDIVLSIVKEIARQLRNNCSDVKVVCTRETDIFLELGRRAEIANKAKADLFISVHVNSIPKNSTRKPAGVQSYTLALRGEATNLEVAKRENSVISYETSGKYNYNIYNPNSSESDIMIELMQQRDMEESVNFAKIAQREMVESAGRQDMGVKQDNFAVLRCTYMPSVLLEVGFISTPNEEKFLMSTKGQMSLAHSIYNAIVQYKEKVTGRKSHLVSIDKYEEDNVEDEQKDTKTVNANDKKQENVTANNKTSAKTSTPAKESNATIENNKPVFKIQILSGSYDLKSNDRQFKGLKTEKFKDGNRYKYFYGSSNDYNETLKKKKEIEKMFPGCYIVAFKNGKIVNTKVAIEEWEKNK